MENNDKIINKIIDFTKPEYKIRVNKLTIPRRCINVNEINNLNNLELTTSNIKSAQKTNNNTLGSPEMVMKSSKSLKIIKELKNIGKKSNVKYPLHRTYSENTYNCPTNLFSSKFSKEEGNILYDFQKNNKYLKSMLNNKNLEEKLSKLNLNQPFTKLMGISLDDCLSKSRKESLSHTKSPIIDNEFGFYGKNIKYDINSYNYTNPRNFLISEDKAKKISMPKINKTLREVKNIYRNGKKNETFNDKEIRKKYNLKTTDQKIEQMKNRMIAYNVYSDDEACTFNSLKVDNDYDNSNFFLYKKSIYEKQHKNITKPNSLIKRAKNSANLMNTNFQINYNKYTIQNISKFSSILEDCFFGYLKRHFDKFINILRNSIQNNITCRNIYHKRNIFRNAKLQRITNKLIPIKTKISNPKNNKDKKYNIQLISNDEYNNKVILNSKNNNPSYQQFYACYKKKKQITNSNSSNHIEMNNKIYKRKKTLTSSAVKLNENSLNQNNNYMVSSLSPLNKNHRFFYELYTDDEINLSNINNNPKKYTTGQLIINHINSSKNYNNYIFNYNSDSNNKDNNYYIKNTEKVNKAQPISSYNNIVRKSINTSGKNSSRQIIYPSSKINPNKIQNDFKANTDVNSKFLYSSTRSHNAPKLNKYKEFLVKNISTIDKKLFLTIKYIWINDSLYNKKMRNKINSFNKIHFYIEDDVSINLIANPKKNIDYESQAYQDINPIDYSKVKYSKSFIDRKNKAREKDYKNYSKTNTFNFYNDNNNIKEKDKDINKIMKNCVKLLVRILNKIMRKKIFNEVRKFNLK